MASGSPAAKAGVRGGTVITEIEGDRLASIDALTKAVADRRPGDGLHLGLKDGGTTRSVSVKLGVQPARMP